MSEIATPKTQKLTTRHITFAALAVMVISLVSAAATGFFNDLIPIVAAVAADTDEAKPLPVNLATLEHVDWIEQARSYTGTIRANRRSDLAFELPGKITEVLVEEGQNVETGTVIAKLDTETLQAQHGAIKAQLNQANFVLDELNAGPRIEKIKSAQANVAAAESEYDNAKLKLKRREVLIQKRAIPIEEYDQATFGARTAKAMLDSAMERLSELRAGTRSEKVAAQLATVQSLEASLKEIDVAIEKSVLVAPFTATVTRRFLDPGGIAQPSAPVVRIVEQNHLEAWVGMPVDIASAAKIGETVYLDVEGQQIRATSSAKISELDPNTRTQTVIYQIDSDATSRIVSGQLCKIRVTSRVDTSGVWVPNSALSKGVRGLWSVMTVAPDDRGVLRIQKRDIEIIKTDSERVLAKGTIKNGDLIVIDGVHRVSNGQAVLDAKAK